MTLRTPCPYSSHMITQADKWNLIDKIGAEMGASHDARQKWRQRGVSHHYRLDMVERARAEGVDLTREDFEPIAESRSAA